MKKWFLVVGLLNCVVVADDGIDTRPILEQETIEGLDVKGAHEIFAALDKFSTAVSKDKSKEKTVVALTELKNKTHDFPYLAQLVDDMEVAITTKDNKTFWVLEDGLRARLRPIFIAARPQFAKPGYFESFMNRLKNMANNVYEWLFPIKQ